MGKSKKKAAKDSKESKELLGIDIVSNSITIDEAKQVGAIPMFNELSFVLWKDRMEAYLTAQGYYVWHSVVFGDTPTRESRKYNMKALNVILSALSDTVKAKVVQYSSTNHLWEKLQDL